jgi:hypothetical protein
MARKTMKYSKSSIYYAGVLAGVKESEKTAKKKGVKGFYKDADRILQKYEKYKSHFAKIKKLYG